MKQNKIRNVITSDKQGACLKRELRYLRLKMKLLKYNFGQVQKKSS